MYILCYFSVLHGQGQAHIVVVQVEALVEVEQGRRVLEEEEGQPFAVGVEEEGDDLVHVSRIFIFMKV